MKKHYCLLLSFLTIMIFFADAQLTQTKRLPIAGIITNYSVDKAYIGMKIEELKTVYSNYNISQDYLSKYGIDSEGYGILISKDNKPIMFVWNMQGKDVIKGIFCLTDLFETENKVKVGSTINDLLKLYPKLSLGRDCLLNEYEYTKLNDIGVYIQFLTIENKTVGKYKTNECQETTTNLNLSRKIDRIEI